MEATVRAEKSQLTLVSNRTRPQQAARMAPTPIYEEDRVIPAQGPPMASPDLAGGTCQGGRSETPARLLSSVLPDAGAIERARQRLHRKAAAILLLDLFSYAVLVIGDVPLWARVLAALVLVHALIATATGIMHDANHGSFSAHRRVNQLASYSADLLGASSLLWRFQHNDLHHRHTNVEGVDADIDQAPFARLSPSQTWKPWHRYQHHYLWLLYGFLTLQWFLVSDIVVLRRGGMGRQKLRHTPSRADVARLVLGKIMHATWAIAIPMMFRPALVVVVWYLACSWLVGFGLAVIFQLAHCVDAAEFVSSDGRWRGDDLVRHQLRTTVDVRVSGPLRRAWLAFLAGGLEYQVAHHLAPRVPHTLYRAKSERVSAMCATNGLSYRVHLGLPAALASHHRWLRTMGLRPATGQLGHDLGQPCLNIGRRHRRHNQAPPGHRASI